MGNAIDEFINNLNAFHIGGPATNVPGLSINLGTDTSNEGRMITEKILKSIEGDLTENKRLYPTIIFKMKSGVNVNKEDKNYDLFKIACQVSANTKYSIYFSNLDASFNNKYYNKEDYNTEATYMRCRTRILENQVDENKAISVGRGNLCAVSINLPRIGIKHGMLRGNKIDLDGFYKELEEKLELAKDILLDIFEIQCSKKINSFPFLLGQEIWLDSEKAKELDKLRRCYKHGTLSIGFIGLSECLKALIGKHHGETKEAQELGLNIITYMRKFTDEFSTKYNLNLNLFATPKELLQDEFTAMDKAVYGKIKGVTDVENYTDSFQLPNNYKITKEQKIEKEAPYHSLTNRRAYFRNKHAKRATIWRRNRKANKKSK